MDKTPEVNSSSENPKIPEDWKFPERNKQGLKVLQIDFDGRFLAFEEPKKLTQVPYLYSGGEYFFSGDGQIAAFRSHGKVETSIAFNMGELRIMYTLPLGQTEPYDSLLGIRFGIQEMGNARYDGGILGLAHLGRLFIEKDLNGIPIESPRLMFGNYEISNGDRKRRYDLSEVSSGNNFAIEGISGKSEARIFNNRHEEVFRLAWGQQELE